MRLSLTWGGNPLIGVSHLSERVQEHGYRLTPGRRAVIEVLERADRHLSPAEILRLGRACCARLSRATVYRTLEQLTALSLIRPIYLGGDNQRFAAASGCDHHLICSRCGRITEFEECGLEALEEAVAAKYSFQITGHLFELHGFCPRCQEQRSQAVEPAS